MLCDLFDPTNPAPTLQMMPPPVRQAIQALGQRVQAAERFTLDRAAVRMVQDASLLRPRQFIAALSICRLPFPRMWVEFDFKDRGDWLTEVAATGAHQKEDRDGAPPPRRLGFYLEEDPHEPQMIYVHPAWVHQGDHPQIALKAMSVCLIPDFEGRRETLAPLIEVFSKPERRKELDLKTDEDIEATADLEWRFLPKIPSYLDGVWAGIRRAGPAAVAEAEEQVLFDLRSEWRFIIALLLVINSRNLIDYGPAETNEKLNKARTKRGKPPLLSHRPIRLNLTRVQQARLRDQVAGRRSPEQAFAVIGHFKVRKTGIWWWSPHERYSHLPRRTARLREVVG